MYRMGTNSRWPKGANSYCWEQRVCGEAGEGAAVGLGVPQCVGGGPKEPAGTCIPLRTMVKWRRKRRKAVVFLHCSISGAYLNPELELQLGPKKCFMSRVLGLRLLFVLVHWPQQERAGVLGTWDQPFEAHGCDSLLGLHCISRAALRWCSSPATVPLLLCCWVRLSLPLPTQHRSPL